MPKIFCVETGRGVKGSVFVCSTPEGDIILRAIKEAPYKYSIFSEKPYGKYKTTMYASTRRELRRRIEEWLEYQLTR